jgi:hypothetical protein
LDEQYEHVVLEAWKLSAPLSTIRNVYLQRLIGALNKPRRKADVAAIYRLVEAFKELEDAVQGKICS